MITLVGLGNPGERYALTRHNVAWIIMDLAFTDIQWQTNSYAQAKDAIIDISGQSVRMVKPQTFMNESGITVHYYLTKSDTTIDELIVLYDDIDLPLGTVKVSFDRGNGGHNGIRSIESVIGSREFVRIRIGIAKKIDDQTIIKPNVLGNFEQQEQGVFGEIAPQVAKIISTIITKGKDQAMTDFNGKII